MLSPASQPAEEGAWTRAKQSWNQASVIQQKLLNLFEVPVRKMEKVITSQVYSED